jgi:hypothetical protein
MPECTSVRYLVCGRMSLPPTTLLMAMIVSRVSGRCWASAWIELGKPFGACIQRLASYLRYTHAINYERLSGPLAQVFGLDINDLGLAHLFLHSTQTVDTPLDSPCSPGMTAPYAPLLINGSSSRFKCEGRLGPSDDVISPRLGEDEEPSVRALGHLFKEEVRVPGCLDWLTRRSRASVQYETRNDSCLKGDRLDDGGARECALDKPTRGMIDECHLVPLWRPRSE